MSPELIKHEYDGMASDVWALGVVLFCMLNGAFPFKAPTDRELFKKICRGGYAHKPGVSDAASKVIKRIFERQEDKRASCSELLIDKWVVGTCDTLF